VYVGVRVCVSASAHSRLRFDRLVNAFYEIGLVNGIELM